MLIVRMPAAARWVGLARRVGADDPEERAQPGNAIKFLQTLFGSQGVALQAAVGPEPINPPRVSFEDWHDVPAVLRPYVRPEHRGH